MKDYTAELKKKVREHLFEEFSPGHGYGHLIRVFNICRKIAPEEKTDLQVLEAAALLHDLGRERERRKPNLDHAEESAKIAKVILKEIDFPQEKAPEVLHAIRSHRFSRGPEPETLEAKILQDADKVDISGAVGIATLFSHGGAHNKQIYNIEDPFAENRKPDDSSFSLDHFYTKVLKLPETLNTEAGRKMAQERLETVRQFLKQFQKEVGNSHQNKDRN